MPEPTPWPDARIAAFGAELAATHHRLRSELERLRADVDAFLDGRAGRPQDLRAHCLAFCAALTGHHTEEDVGVFPGVAARIPELAPVIANLVEDHRAIAGILRALQDLVDGIAPEPDAAAARRVRGELDGLTAIMTSHFQHEERRLTAVLREMRSPDHQTSP